jgi:hypothetical protein
MSEPNSVFNGSALENSPEYSVFILARAWLGGVGGAERRLARREMGGDDR